MSTSVYTPATLAKTWGCSERLIRNLVNAGELRAFKLGRKLVRITADAAEEYVRCRQNTASPDTGESGPSPFGSTENAATDFRLARLTERKLSDA